MMTAAISMVLVLLHAPARRDVNHGGEMLQPVAGLRGSRRNCDQASARRAESRGGSPVGRSGRGDYGMATRRGVT
jgi:hypothetical protein